MIKRPSHLSFLLLVLFAFCSTTLSAEPAKKMQIGLILPLSGSAAGIGNAIKNGFEMGLEKISKRARDQIEINYEDDGLAPKNSVTAFKKLAANNKVDILLNASSGTAKALAPLAESSKVPFFSIASDPEIVKNKKYVFNFWVSPDVLAKVAIAEAQKRGYKKIARISTLVDGAVALNNAFDKFNQGQIEMAMDEQFPSDITDFKAYIAKLKNQKNIDAVLVILFPGQSGLFAKQARQLGVTQDLFSMELFEDSTAVKESNGALLGCWYVNNDDPQQTFLDEYKMRFPGATLWGASTGHDAALVIGNAIDEGYSKDNFQDYLTNLKDFSGALGTFSASGDNRFTIPAAVKIVTNDGFEKLYK